MKSFAKFLVFVVITSFLGAGVYSYYRSTRVDEPKLAPETATLADGPRVDLKDVQILDALNREYTTLIKNIVPAVVSINTSKRVFQPEIYADQFGRVYQGSGGRSVSVPNSLGSGVIVSKEGHILTNNHVIASSRSADDEIEVLLSDGRSLPATVIDADKDTDIAILKIEGKDFQPLPFGDSDQVLVGERVFAVGNPFGLAESVTDGIISAKGRQSMDDTNISEFLQTNAAINPGNSGGPLINIRGEIIGINTMIASQSGGFQGIGLAVPSNTARRVFESIISRGRVLRGYLGVGAIEWTPRIMEQLGVDRPEGALVGQVTPGSPAERANIRPLDIIVRFAGKPVKSFSELRREVLRREINEEVEIEILRDGQKIVVRLTIEEPQARVAANTPMVPNMPPSPANPIAPVPSSGPSVAAGAVLGGIEVQDLTPKTREQLRLPEKTTGVVIRSIPAGSNAWEKLRVNDVIESINKQQVNSVEDFLEAARTLNPSQPHTLTICRERTRSVVMILPS